MTQRSQGELDRRSLLTLGAGGLLALGLPRELLCQPGEKSSLRIERIRYFRINSRRWKVVGKNSHKGVHGDRGNEGLLLVETGRGGPVGIGAAAVTKEQCTPLLGTDPLSHFKPGVGIVSSLGRRDAPLWDLVGKVLEQPTWRLFGGYGPEWVPIYDGSIYFTDLQPEYESSWRDRFREELDYSLERGHRAFKIKVGRGFKWMEHEAGFRRDIEVLRLIREHVGTDVKLGVDSNNGYDLATARRFIEDVGVDLYFAEEMFPEEPALDLELKNWLRKRGLETLVADGESAKDTEHFTPYIESGALDVLQADMKRFGYTLLLTLSRMSHPSGLRLAPHNWGSFLGFYMQLILGRGIPNFLMAEQDPITNDLFDTSAFVIADGKARVSDAPGCGLELDEKKLLSDHKFVWELKS